MKKTLSQLFIGLSLVVLLAPLGSAFAEEEEAPMPEAVEEETTMEETSSEEGAALGSRFRMLRRPDCSKLRRTSVSEFNACRKEFLQNRQSILEQRRATKEERKDFSKERMEEKKADKPVGNREEYLKKFWNLYDKTSPLHEERKELQSEGRRAWMEQRQKQGGKFQDRFRKLEKKILEQRAGNAETETEVETETQE